MRRPPVPIAFASGATTRLGFEVERGARAIGLRGDDEIVVGHGAARPRYDRIEQEFVVLAIEHQHDGTFVDGISRFGLTPAFQFCERNGTSSVICCSKR